MKLKTIFAIVKANIGIWYYKLTNQYKKILPYKILLNLTDLCNSRCTFCEIWKIKPQNEINLDNINNIFDSLNKNLLWLSLSGGEITLVNYYYELVDEAVRRCKNLKILAFTTNALSVSKALKYALYAKEKGLDVLITISLDGDKETHDKLRGIPGNFDKCEKLYNELKNNKINVVYGITVSDQNTNFIKDNDLINWNECIRRLHFKNDAKNNKSYSYRRLVFDELCANFLTLSENRKRFKKIKTPKKLDYKYEKFLINNLPFKLTSSQNKVLKEINSDLSSNKRMFRIVQGDVGSGKTIVSFPTLSLIKDSFFNEPFLLNSPL